MIKIAAEQGGQKKKFKDHDENLKKVVAAFAQAPEKFTLLHSNLL